MLSHHLTVISETPRRQFWLRWCTISYTVLPASYYNLLNSERNIRLSKAAFYRITVLSRYCIVLTLIYVVPSSCNVLQYYIYEGYSSHSDQTRVWFTIVKSYCIDSNFCMTLEENILWTLEIIMKIFCALYNLTFSI